MMLRSLVFAAVVAAAVPAAAQDAATILRQSLLDKDMLLISMQKKLDETIEYARKCRIEPGCFEAAKPEPKPEPEAKK